MAASLACRRILVCAAALAAPALTAPTPAAAWQTPTSSPPAADAATAERTAAQESARTGPTDPAELAAFLDGVMEAQLAEKRVAGATLAVVRNGEILLARGYGYANVDDRTPVDPERTLFRIGSVSKLFTWTAVMQLEEEGRVDLDTDVNEYIDFRIPDTFSEPITLRHLLQHTPGFEEDSRGLFTDSPEGIEPLGDWLADNLPARVRPPGTFSAYSNYGTALAGYVVERVSGISWDEYIEAHILEPLGMTRTTGRQPLPGHLEPLMSEGYSVQNGGWHAEDWEIITAAAPAGSMSATATDMARFMIAHLQEGELDGARILEPPTARRMHEGRFRHDPRIPGFGLGFYEKTSHGVRIVGHGGNTRWFHTDLAIFPELDLGVFVSYNSAGGSDLSFGPFLDAFLDHYFPVPPAEAVADDGFEERVAGLTGDYRFNRTSYTTFQKAFELAGGTIPVRAVEGAIVTTLFGPELRMVEVGENLFREEFGETLMAFRVDEGGRATHAFLSPGPMMALERVPWHGSSALHQGILGGGLVLFLGILWGATSRFFRKRWGGGITEAPRRLGAGRRAMVFAAAAFTGFAVWLGVLASDFWGLLTGPLIGLRIALLLPLVGLAAALVAAVQFVRGVRAGESGRWLRFRLGAGVTVALLFTWSLHYWNLLGWRM